MITVDLPDGRSVDVDTDDKAFALKSAQNFYDNNPIQERAVEFGEEDVSAPGEIARAIGAGLVGGVEGLASFPAEIIDFVSDGETNQAETVREFYSQFKPTTSTGLGEAVKFLTQFAVPGGLAAKAAKAYKLGKAGQLGAFGAADVLATTPDVETLGDFFDGGPTKRIDTDQLEGSERAAAELTNRLKVAAEGAAIVLGAPKILGLAGAGIGATADAVSRTSMAQKAAQKAESALSAVKDKETLYKLTGVNSGLENPQLRKRMIDKAYSKLKNNFTFQGEMPNEVAKQLDAIKLQQVSSDNQFARNSFEEIDNGLKSLKKAGKLNAEDERYALNALNDFMFAEPRTIGGKTVSRELVRQQGRSILESLDKEIASSDMKSLFGKKDYSLLRSAEDFRGYIDNLSTSLSKEDQFLDPDLNKALVKAIGETNQKYYGTRLYRTIKSSQEYVPSMEQIKAAQEEIIEASRQAGDELTPDQALSQLNVMRSNVQFSNAKMKPNMMFEEETLKGVKQGVLKNKKLDNLPAIRDFLGEYSGGSDVIGRVRKDGTSYEDGVIRQRSLEEQRIGLRTKAVETVDVISKQLSQASYFKNLLKYNDSLPPESKFILDNVQITRPEDLGAYSRIGFSSPDPTGEITESMKMRFGPLAGKYVKKDYLRALEDAKTTLGDGPLNKLYATFLGIKGMSQVAKTVYSPITQIRNATTAAFFALKNGNFGNGETLLNSMQTVLSQIGQRKVGEGLSLPGSIDKGLSLPRSNAKAGSKQAIDEYYRKMIELGIVNSNAKMGEFESLFKDALQAKSGVLGGNIMRKVLSAAENTQNRFSGKLYQGSDDVWKIYSYEMELGRLRDAFSKSPTNIPVTDARNIIDLQQSGLTPSQLKGDQLENFLQREAAEIVKDTVPNYARVPEFIKTLRKAPLGNFIAFPAEIIRTSGNVIGRSIKELASESPEIRSIGMRRLMGSLAVDGGIAGGLSASAMMLTGSSQEQVDAFKRSFAQDWEKNATLIPIASDKDGNVTEVYNFSYTNPYDYLTKPARAAFNAVNNGITAEKDLSNIVLDAAWESSGEFFSPFFSESIITEKILNLGRNKNAYGGQIYNDADPLGLKVSKGFAHFAEGLTPGISPISLKGDVSSPAYIGYDVKDFPRAIGQALGADAMSGVNKRGVRIDAAGKFVEALSGVKTIKLDIEKTLQYRGYEAARQVREASRIFNQVAKSRGKVEASAVTKAYILANEQRFKALRDLSVAIDDAEKLGIDKSSIYKSLSKAKTPHIPELFAKQFVPFFPSSQTISEAIRSDSNKVSNPFDMTAIGSSLADFSKMRYTPKAVEERQQQMAQPPGSIMPPPIPGAVPPPSPPPPQSLFNRGIEALRDIELDKLMGS